MLRLRTSDGLDMTSFAASFGDDAAESLHRAMEGHIRQGLVLKLPRLSTVMALAGSGGTNRWDFRIRLSDPEGFLLSNSIISDAFAAFRFE